MGRPHIAIQPTLFDEPEDDLFNLRTHICEDCMESFETSKRTSRYCATCASLRLGQVGPATVVCPGCGVEHKIAVLAPHKLCPACRAHPDIRADLRARLDAAESAHAERLERLAADLAHADDNDRARYDATIAYEHTWDAERWQRAVDRVLGLSDDGLRPLLEALLAMRAAYTTLERVRSEVQAGLAEVERAR